MDTMQYTKNTQKVRHTGNLLKQRNTDVLHIHIIRVTTCKEEKQETQQH